MSADPLHGTLLILPWIVVALALVARRIGATWRRGGPAALLLLLALVLLAVVHRGLGLDNLDRPIYAGLLLLLGWRLATLLPSLRRLLGRRLPSRPPAVFYLLPLIVYLGLLPWSTHQRAPDGDEPYYLLLTHSLAYDLDVDLADNYDREDWRVFLDRPLAPQPGDPTGPGGEVYSRHNLLLPLLLAPAYRLAGLAGALATMAALTALLPWLVLRLAHHAAPDAPRGGLFVWGLCAFAPPLLFYSQQIWIEVPAALLVAMAYDRVWVLRRRAADRAAAADAGGRVAGGSATAATLGLGATLALLPLLKLRLIVPGLGLLLLALAAFRRRAWLAAGVLAGALGAIFALNQLRFDNPLKMHRWSELDLFAAPPPAFLLGGLGTFYDVAYGLFAYAPLWLLLLPAVWLALRRRRRLLVDVALVGGPYLLLLAPRLEWYGGWSPPFRYGLVLLPLLAVLLSPLFDRRRPGVRFSLAVLAPLTLLLAILFMTVPGWSYNLADGGTHLLDAGGARLGRDVARLFPSMVRPRLATWLWPLASLLLIPLALRLPRRLAPRPSWGVTVVLGLVALVPLVAGALRTRTVELEDGYVTHRGGTLQPSKWTLERPRHRGGWAIVEGAEAIAPVIGEGRVSLRLALRHVDVDLARPFVLAVFAGGTPLFEWRARGGGWQVLEIGPVDWPAGAPLVLRGPAIPPDRVVEGRGPDSVIVDYVDFRWH